MADSTGLGRLFIVLGAVLVLVGLAVTFGPRLPWLGRLPGDFSFGSGAWRVYVPLGTSILVSVILTLLLWLVGRK
jgi:hypothetical protein